MPAKGGTQPPEARAKISESNRRRTLSPESRKKISDKNRGRKWTPERKAQQKARHDRWLALHPNDIKAYRIAYNLRKKYGMTQEAFDAMLAGQGGVCAICGTSDFSAGNGQRPVVDHDHETGAIRGILCFGCNIGIGAFKEKLAIVRAAVAYLERT